MAKFKIKDAAMTALGATGGAFGGNWIDDQITEKVEDPKMEIGAKLLAMAGAVYFSQQAKGFAKDAAIAAVGALGNGVVETARDMMGSDDKPTKGINDELNGIYDEIDQALKMNGNDATVTGNDATVTGNDAVVTGANYEDNQD